MILNTGNRTDIPAYFSKWFYKRIDEGYVMTRNPFNTQMVSKYILDPKLVDVICFCTKNPQPMLENIEKLDAYRQLWYVSITPYGRDIEPNVPNKHKLIESFKQLSNHIGSDCVMWRYDPILITNKYSFDYHLRAFEKIANELGDYTKHCTISFIDLYDKTVKNFPEAREVPYDYQVEFVKQFVSIGERYGIKIYTCAEHQSLAKYGANIEGCMSKNVMEVALNNKLNVPSKLQTRNECSCLLGSDIGMYNTCLHGCKYCYANYDMKVVHTNFKNHDPNSPLLIGNICADDIIKEAKQVSFLSKQLELF